MNALTHSTPSLPITAGLRWLGICLLLSQLLSCSSKPKSEVVVSVKDQRLGIYDEGKLVKQYTISTSKFGLGDRPGSNRTPLGKHEIIAKIGHGLPAGAVLKSRSWNGEVLKPNAPGRDPIVSRILWLRGMESSNRNAMNRYIYIHGTPEENRLGTPASYGCIRMGMKDVVEVFDELGIGAKVVVTKGGLPQGHKAESQPTPEAETVIAEKVDKKSNQPDGFVSPAEIAQPVATPELSHVEPKMATDPKDTQPHQDTNPVAKGKQKKASTKSEKITTSNRRTTSSRNAHG